MNLVKCFICDGQGFFIITPENCDSWLDCPECHGKGWLTEQEIEDSKPNWIKPKLINTIKTNIY
jgi:DnaJ-class molecular chaperone